MWKSSFYAEPSSHRPAHCSHDANSHIIVDKRRRRGAVAAATMTSLQVSLGIEVGERNGDGEMSP